MRYSRINMMAAIGALALGSAGAMRPVTPDDTQPSEPARVKAKPSEPKGRTHAAIGSGTTEAENLRIAQAHMKRARKANRIAKGLRHVSTILPAVVESISPPPSPDPAAAEAGGSVTGFSEPPANISEKENA